MAGGVANIWGKLPGGRAPEQGNLLAVAVDALKLCAELELGMRPPEVHPWEAPYRSDWTIGVGEFPR